VGVVAKIVQVLKQPDDITRVVVEGQQRAYITESYEDDMCMLAEVKTIEPKSTGKSAREVALVRQVKSLFERYTRVTPKMPSDILFKVALCKDGGELADFITSNIFLDYQEKQHILNAVSVEKRLEKLIDLLNQEIFILEIEQEIEDKAREKIELSQREYFLREQKSVIEAELGEDDNPLSDAEEYREKILALKLPEKSQSILLKECKKLTKMPYGSQEVSVIRTYLDNVLELPWNVSTKDVISLPKIRKTLDKNHYGLTKVKERIVEHLAVCKLNENVKGNIICLVGPPGVGKTSIAQSVASAIGRKSARIALGGVHDEAEIRGHRRTYVGSMPGRIINAIKTAGTNNPVLVLDEIDKVSSDYKGDPSSALLEVLDGEQNSNFTDHYLDIPFDLSKVLFITTANDASQIPAPLYDRMEIIDIDSYTREEKFNIAKKHLIPKQLKENGLDNKILKFTNKGIYSIIDFYTREAGVRSLERTIAKVMRKVAVRYLDDSTLTFKITDTNVQDYLGVKKYTLEKLEAVDEVGVVNGLAWTSVGGTLLPIEVALVAGDGKIELTGSLGEVMQESAKIAITCIRAHSEQLGIDSDFYKNYDIHIHAPEGAVPKDGPSAGITMATAIYSAVSNRPVKKDVAMTGEITLRGKILPIGGLKEKTMAAYKAGVTKVYIPKDNVPNLEEVDPVVKENVMFVPVEYFTEVINDATIPAPLMKKDNDIIINDSRVHRASVRQ
jgi:ATP-dependent Lon protease